MPALLSPVPITDATRREFLALLGAAGLLAGCGAGPTPDAAGGAPGFPRTITHLGGELELSAPPTRIALTNNRYLLDELLLLDTVPAAYAATASEELPIWTREELARRGATVDNYNGGTLPNYEQLAAMAPDLIIGYDLDTAEDLATLRRIAPVVQVPYTDLDGSRLPVLAQIVGREDLLDGIEARVDADLAAVTPPTGDVAIVFGYRDGAAAAQVYNGDGRSELAVLERAGFTLILFWTPLATPFLVETLNELVASYGGAA